MNDVMNPEEKILYVLAKIDEAYKISPSNGSVLLDPEVILKDNRITQVELDSILGKLESESVLSVVQHPNDIWADVGREDEPRAYKLKISDKFNSYYQNYYSERRFGTYSLTEQNIDLVMAVMSILNDELGLTGNRELVIKNLADSESFEKGLKFLQKVGAVESYEAKFVEQYDPDEDKMVPSDFFSHFVVKISLPKFDETISRINGRILDRGTSAPNTEPLDSDVREYKVVFDPKASRLKYGNKICNIPDGSLEYYVCKLAFKNRRVGAKEEDILEFSTKNQDSKRAVYDAMQRVNKKMKKDLGVDKLLFYKAAKVRVAKNYQ